MTDGHWIKIGPAFDEFDVDAIVGALDERGFQPEGIDIEHQGAEQEGQR